ncbi:hypothetical protein HHX47_DHR9000095 [Lentinula edodes]|nr:hypothetical protein HHX47_DHR9000095 [Lentinula edodes]
MFLELLNRLSASSLRRFIHNQPRRMRYISLKNAVMDRVMAPDELKIQLTETEEKICVLLDKCKEYLLAEKGISTTCRIAGGWVRDKLLGSQSNDLDIALSDIMGLAFAQHLAEFAKSQNIEVGTISKIAQNPDQSKHLETATFKMFGLEIDLVNLRSEEYASNSRIPTEVGLNDLRNGIIRTPLPPRETFLDDPLRIIRCIRFASRFGFQFVPELENAEALVSKVARERAGMELTKMMKGRDPVHAISLIQDLSLFDPIFSVIPTDVVSTFSHPRSANIDSLKATSILRLLLSDTYTGLTPLHPLLTKAIHEDTTCKDRLYLAATLTPYLGVTYKDKKHREFPAITYVIRESLKLGTQNHYLDGIPALFAASEILKNPDLNQEKFRQSSERVIIASEKITIYNRFVERVEELALTSAVDAKPLVDGREIVSLLNVKAGPWTGTALARVVEWQLEHPEGSKGECLMWLKEQLSAGTLGIDQNGPVSKKARIYK